MFFLNPFILSPAGGDFESIATVTVGSGGASSIEFTSIPGTYQHLQLRGIMRYSTGAPNPTENLIGLRFNADSTSSYARHILYGNGSSATAYAEINQAAAWGIESISSAVTANVFAAGVIDILDYANTSKNTTVRVATGYDANGSGIAFVCSGAFFKTNAITSVTAVPLGGHTGFAQHSTLALYGVKAP